MSSTLPSRTPARLVRQPDIDALLCELRQLYVCTGLRLALEMGRLIIERIFDGDLASWRSRGRKDISFRKLEKHPQLPFHASTLWRAVAIYLLSIRRCDLASLRHVSPSHLNEIAGLGEAEQDRLLDKVESEQWSTRRLRQEVTRISGRRRRRDSDPAAFSRWLRRIGADVGERGLPCDLDAIDRLNLEECRDLLDTTKKIVQQMEILARKLGIHAREAERRRRGPELVPRLLVAGGAKANA